MAVSFPAIAPYRITSLLYEGSRTLVYQGIRRLDGQPVILKLLQGDFPAVHDLLRLCNQYTITKNLTFPGVVQPLGLEPYGKGFVLIMPDEGYLSLSNYIAAHPLDLPEFWAIALQLTDILHNLYQQRILHKDINPTNILIQPESKQIQLTDFGFASLLPKETIAVKHPNILEGTLAYLAPEQTGRMNRGIDYRTDFYAVGVTFFELLTGELPFAANDALELVHCHIAKPAPLVCDLKPELPAMLGQLVAKLMAKNAEDRYQSALGLKHDLQTCLEQWQSAGKITAFELATQDRSDRFVIPDKLYGREQDVAALLAAFERVSHGISELVLVAGFSGIGKTAVVNEVHKPIVRQRGYFIKGKFDQFQRDIPFSAFVQAFRDLIGQLLSESDAQLSAWKTKILTAVGENGQVILAVIPELERIIGPQPTVPELSGSAAQHRFNRLFQNFIHVFTTSEHPLVMFLDDLQWADSASLQLLPLLLQDGKHLLLLGAYRDNEVSPTHPLMLTVRNLEKSGATVHTLNLPPLNQADINQLVADTLKCDSRNEPYGHCTLAQPLTTLVYQKAQGNPFFTTQFLKALHQDGDIQFKPETGYWLCDISQIKIQSLTDDVVLFMAQQLQKLSPATQAVLQLAACIGNQFDLQTLAIVSEQSEIETATALWSALQDGLIIPLNQIYKFFQAESQDRRWGAGSRGEPSVELGVVESDACIYRFLHDRVQQAAYSLIRASQKEAVHLQIGRLLLERIPGSDREANLFQIVNQLNQGIPLMREIGEQEALAQLNWQAGKKARTSSAYDAARTYLNTGLQLLSPQGWQTQYDLSLGLHQLAAEVAYISGAYSQMAALVEDGLHHAKDHLDRAKFYEIQVLALVAQNQARAAVDYARKILPSFGVQLPKNLSKLRITLGFLATLYRMLGKTPQDLLALPIMSDPDKLAACSLFNAIGAASERGMPEVLPFMTFIGISLYLKYGNIPKSSMAYTIYAFLLCEKLGRIEDGYAMGKAAIALCHQTHSKEALAPTLFLWNYFVAYRKESLHSLLPSLLEAYQVSLEVGDIQYAAYSLSFRLGQAYWSGQNLTDLYQESITSRPTFQQFQQQAMIEIHNLNCQSLENLTTETEDVCRLVGQFFDETAIPPDNRQLQVYTSLRKLQFAVLFQRYPLAMQESAITESLLQMIDGTFSKTLFYFYDALLRLALYPHLPKAKQRTYCTKIKAHRKRLAQLAKFAPMNYQHKLLLVDAEFLRVLGKRSQAGDVYDEAIAAAKANGYLHEEALASELAAQFYLAGGKEKIAAGYMQEAYYSYARWGATAKTNHLEHHYPSLLAPILKFTQPTISPRVNPRIASQDMWTLSNSSTYPTTSLSLDLNTVLQASQTLFSTIELDHLLQTLIQLVATNTGADKAVLFLKQDGLLKLGIAYFHNAIQTLQIPSLDECQQVPRALIHYVERTLETVITDYKTHVSTLSDPYCLQSQPQSLLCTPILKQGQLIAILYLENAITANAFTDHQVELLKVLCAQAAISLENARLYQQAQSYAQRLETSLTQLQASETRFHHLVANIPGMIFQLRIAVDGATSVPYASSGCYDLYEVTAETMMAGQYNFRDFEHPEDRPVVDQKLAETAPTLQPFRLEFRIVTLSGKVKWIQAISQPAKQPDGAFIWNGVVMDISERVQLEAERKAVEAKLQSQTYQLARANQQLANYSQTLEQKVEERTQELSQALASLQSAQAELIQSEKMAVLGQITASVAHEINTPLGVIRAATANIAAAQATSLQQLPILIRRLSAQQQEDFLALVNAALQSGLSLSTREGRQLRQQLQTELSALGLANSDQIAAQLTLLSLGPDLKPYQSILQNPHCNDLLKMAYELVLQSRNTNYIQQEVDRAAKIIFALKSYSHRSVKTVRYLNQIIDGIEVALTLYQNRFNQGIQVIRDYASEIPAIMCNPDELTQVWVNLIDNALYAMGQKGTLSIAIFPRATDLVVQIADSGSGIPPEMQAQIFQPFFTTKPRGEGSGLGLDIVRQIVQKHAGSIQVDSRPGQTIFTVTFPLPSSELGA